jgi:predicted nucleotidyltransferase
MQPRSFIAKKRKIITTIAKAHGATNIRVFGSHARGEAGPESDIDLIIELEPGRSLLDLITIKLEIEDHVHRKVDIVTEAALSPYIREDILRDTVTL